MPDLTTLAAVKDWLNVTSDNGDPLLSSLISQVSSVILSYLSRGDILKRQYVEQFSGTGQSSKALRNYPVISVSSVSAGFQTLQPSNGLTPGFYAIPDDDVPPGRIGFVHLNGYRFERQLCKITYEAGYFIGAEPQTAALSVSALAPYGSWARDEGVTYANGTALTPVASNPVQGQYALNARIPGQYVFAAADVGQPILLNYSFIPGELERACIETVAERYRYKDRIGQTSKNVSGEVLSFSLKDMQDFVKLSLQPFRKVVPV